MEARMNDEADFYASSSQKLIHMIPEAPIPTFCMNEYTFFREADGWIESNIVTFVDTVLARGTAQALGIGNRHRMSTWAHDSSSPPEYPYLKAVSAHSAAVQLYARSGQLATADVLHSRGKLEDDRCLHGCDAVEDMHHLFVHCWLYNEWRREAADEIVEKTRLKLENLDIEEIIRDGLLKAAKSLFVDDPTVWPLHYSMFYLGQLPDLDLIIESGVVTVTIGEIKKKRLKAHISSDWHTSSIRLAGRIFGDYQRRVANSRNCTRRK
jgi:hypothetical protein